MPLVMLPDGRPVTHCYKGVDAWRLVNGRLLANRIPDARLHVVEGGGHLFLFTRGEEMAGIVGDFLDTGASKARRQLHTTT